MYNKELIDEQAENEGMALKKQGIKNNSNYKRTRLYDETTYNKATFDKLFIKD